MKNAIQICLHWPGARCLAIPATSVPSGRAFSTAGLTITKQRAALESSTADTIIFLNKNLRGPMMMHLLSSVFNRKINCQPQAPSKRQLTALTSSARSLDHPYPLISLFIAIFLSWIYALLQVYPLPANTHIFLVPTFLCRCVT